MLNDASSAGVRLGGLFSTAEIKILVCYILNSINEPIPAAELAGLLHLEGIANAFEVSDAIVSLSKSGHIKSADQNDSSYIITNEGKKIALELGTSISMVAKQRAYLATVKMLSRMKNTRDSEFTVSEENGSTFITCSVTDGRMPFLTVKLLVADKDQAYAIKEKFIDNPAGVYHAVIDYLTRKED